MGMPITIVKQAFAPEEGKEKNLEECHTTKPCFGWFCLLWCEDSSRHQRFFEDREPKVLLCSGLARQCFCRALTARLHHGWWSVVRRYGVWAKSPYPVSSYKKEIKHVYPHRGEGKRFSSSLLKSCAWNNQYFCCKKFIFSTMRVEPFRRAGSLLLLFWGKQKENI